MPPFALDFEQPIVELDEKIDGLKRLSLIDEIISEPMGGAHRSPQEMATALKSYLVKEFSRLRQIPTDELLERCYDKFRRIEEG